jgi:hypothetical protein
MRNVYLRALKGQNTHSSVRRTSTTSNATNFISVSPKFGRISFTCSRAMRWRRTYIVQVPHKLLKASPNQTFPLWKNIKIGNCWGKQGQTERHSKHPERTYQFRQCGFKRVLTEWWSIEPQSQLCFLWRQIRTWCNALLISLSGIGTTFQLKFAHAFTAPKGSCAHLQHRLVASNSSKVIVP